MRIVLSLSILALLLIAACAPQAAPPKEEPNAPPQIVRGFTECLPEQRGNKICTLDYTPVCGKRTDGSVKTYGNACGACSDEKVIGYDAGECAEETAPAEEQMAKHIECPPEARGAEFCTAEYDPVCATVDTGIRCVTEPCPSGEQQTFSNACEACKDAKVLNYQPGTCEDLGVGVLETGESCPAGMDRYATQLGFRCIESYDEKLIKSWAQCSRQSQCRGETRCAYAPRTTTGEEIVWIRGNDEEFVAPGFRCVPPDYADLLLHSSGLTTRDNNGAQSTVIA